MNFIQRLGYYLIGLMIGAFAVYFFLQQKETETFCYFPNCRVLKDLRSKPFHTSNESKVFMTQTNMSLDDIRLTLKHGDVDFSKSNLPEGNAKIYVVNGRNSKNENVELTLLNFSERVELKSIKKL